MKKFNVKALSMAIAAAVISSAAGAADSSDLLLKTKELEQAVNGFAAGSNFVATNEDGSKTVRKATQADVEADGFGGLGLKEVVAAHDEALGDLTETVNDNSEALVKTAEVVNAISADVNANKAALEEQKEANEGFNNAIASLDEDISTLKKVGLAAADALEVNRQDIDANKAAIDKKADKADFEELAKYTADMGKKVNDIGDEVTALSDATSAAITRHDKDIVDLAQAGLKATEALEANRKDIDANTAAIETKADKADFEELAKYTADMGKKVNDIGDEVTALSDATSAAITRHDKDIVDLAQAGLKATEALEANRKDIDANTAAIETKADKADFEELAKYTADMGKKVNDIGDEVTALSDATSAAITRHDKDIVDLAQAGLKATEALEANRKDIDANTAAIETKADKADFEELAKYTADMGKKVNDIGDEVTALSDATSAAITRHDKDIVDLAQAGLKATEALEANRKDIDANKKYIGDLALAGKAAADALEANRQDIDANKAAIAENTAKLEEQKEANEGFNNAIASLDKDIGDLALAGKAAADALEANRQDIDANKAAIAENTAKLEEQKEANEGFNNAIASLDKDIGDLALAGKAAADALEANRQDIDANKAAIETKADKTAVESVRTIAVEAQKSAQVVKGAVEVAQKSAETAESHAKAAKTSADAANNVASAAQTAAAQAQDAVKANATQVAANKADIATLQTASNQHAAGIAKNSARIDNLDKNVANLRKETRQGLAAQAALSGLFQPYSVGKFNVTAALGGFKSDTAVAVGAGYRFNENFAAKAGLAVGTSSGGSASYNVGVNYEW